MTIGGGLHSVGRADHLAVGVFWLEPTGNNPIARRPHIGG